MNDDQFAGVRHVRVRIVYLVDATSSQSIDRGYDGKSHDGHGNAKGILG